MIENLFDRPVAPFVPIGIYRHWHDNVLCWSTKGLSAPKQNVIYGPHYRQDRRYKRWLYDSANKDSVRYNVRFNMALNYDTNFVSLNEDVCVIKAIFTYKEVYSNDSAKFFNEPFLTDTLKVGEFNIDSSFKYFNFGGRTYKYRPEFFLPAKLDNRVNSPQYDLLYYTDSESYTGIQFCVDWLREDTLCALYIDYVEVYDNNGWNDFMGDSLTVAETIQNIKTYAQSYNNQNWQNIKYWVGSDEPYSIDAYVPMKTVDEILESIDVPRLLTKFYPWWEVTVNKDTQLVRYYNAVQPKKLIIDFYPKEIIRQKYLKFEYLK